MTPPRCRGFLEPGKNVGPRRARVDQQAERRRRHVLARLENPAQLAARHLEPAVRRRHVAERVGVERDRRVEVLGRDHARPVDAGQLTRVLARLVVAVHDETDELELGVVDDPPERMHPRVPGTEVHDPIRHDALRSNVFICPSAVERSRCSSRVRRADDPAGAARRSPVGCRLAQHQCLADDGEERAVFGPQMRARVREAVDGGVHAHVEQHPLGRPRARRHAACCRGCSRRRARPRRPRGWA